MLVGPTIEQTEEANPDPRRDPDQRRVPLGRAARHRLRPDRRVTGERQPLDGRADARRLRPLLLDQGRALAPSAGAERGRNDSRAGSADDDRVLRQQRVAGAPRRVRPHVSRCEAARAAQERGPRDDCSRAHVRLHVGRLLSGRGPSAGSRCPGRPRHGWLRHGDRRGRVPHRRDTVRDLDSDRFLADRAQCDSIPAEQVARSADPPARGRGDGDAVNETAAAARRRCRHVDRAVGLHGGDRLLPRCSRSGSTCGCPPRSSCWQRRRSV